jgi:hypothetical protein
MQQKHLRDKLMQTQRVVCTGNPDNEYNLAHGIKKIFPDATFIHKSAGWDLLDTSAHAVDKLKNLFANSNTFVNASYVGHFAQSRLLKLYHQTVKHADVFNIGSTHEYDGLGSKEYCDSKLDLRKNSLELNSYRFQTHHIIVGGIQKSCSDNQLNWLTINEICAIIPWILSQRFSVPIIAIDHPKEGW